MSVVGIVANPASGKDIRRLVAHGSVFDNGEKMNIVRRVLVGLESAGVGEVLYMPDYFGICARALDGLKLSINVQPLDMFMKADQRDSAEAARLMVEEGVGCIVTLGGDGTNRAVAKNCGLVPIVPISTGTNNVFPYMVEGTLAGIAAGIVATDKVDLEKATNPTRRLEISVDGEFRDIALIDVVVSKDTFIASRALWDMSRVREIILARVGAGGIGMSSVGGCLPPSEVNGRKRDGMHILVGESSRYVNAPIAPGLISRIGIEKSQYLEVGESVEISHKPCIIAVDGERELEIPAQADVRVHLTGNGPRVVDIQETLAEASRLGLFLQTEE